MQIIKANKDNAVINVCVPLCVCLPKKQQKKNILLMTFGWGGLCRKVVFLSLPHCEQQSSYHH